MSKGFGGTEHKLVKPGYRAPKATPRMHDNSSRMDQAGLKGGHDVPRSPHSTPGNRDGMKGGAMGGAGQGGVRKPAASSSRSLKGKR
jgi:hypothetical protein